MASQFKTRRELEDEDHEIYLKKQEEMLERRRAKREAEGFKCTTEGCGQSFKEYIELQSHVQQHQEEYRKNMQCSQAKCGQKFNNRRAYNEHIEMHRAAAKVKIMSNIRSVLLVNKHGLLMEAFDREYKSVMGKQVPYKMLGYNSSYDLVSNIPDVVHVTQLNGGQTLLLAVPDKTTEHIAKMIGNQRANRDGFNYRTGEVLASVGRDVLRKIEKVANRSNRVVPDFMKKQVEQLIEMDAIEGGVDLNEFREIYDQEFGYPLEFRCYGFYSQEDFVFHGLAEVVELVLDGFCWKIVPVGFTSPDGSPAIQDIPLEVRSSMRKLLEENPFGMSVTTLIRTHESCYGQLNLRQVKCKDVVELCMLMPDICVVDKSDMVEFTILPAGYKVVRKNVDDKKIAPLWVLGEVKNNMWKVLQSLTSDVALSTFAKGYEGYYGYLNLAELQCSDMVELCSSIPDVCTLKLGKNGEHTIGQANKEERDGARKSRAIKFPPVPSSIAMSIKRVLVKNPGGVIVSTFFEKYLETIGENIDVRKLGFLSLKSLLSSLDGKLLKFETSGQDLMVTLVAAISSVQSVIRAREQLVQAGWVSVVQVVSPDLVYMQTDSMMDKLWRVEEEMERFYTGLKAGQKMLTEEILVGQVVAALFDDMFWYRGRVVAVKNEVGVAEIFFVDHGWNALVKISTLRCLDRKFSCLPEQVVPVRLSGVVSVGAGLWGRKAVQGLQAIVEGGKRRGWVQIRGENVVDLFMNSTGKNGIGKMGLVSQTLVDRGLAVTEPDHRVGVLDRGLMWKGQGGLGVTKFVKPRIALQKLVLASLIRTRVG